MASRSSPREGGFEVGPRLGVVGAVEGDVPQALEAAGLPLDVAARPGHIAGGCDQGRLAEAGEAVEPGEGARQSLDLACPPEAAGRPTTKEKRRGSATE
jgi:hypothetical protein